jgi:hypothetical protein
MRTGEAIDLYRHPLAPRIDVIQGKNSEEVGPGEKPHGLAHIDEEHGEAVMDHFQEILDGLDQHKWHGDRLILFNAKGDTAVIAQVRNGKYKSWVLYGL